jgi:hypothetical protein
LNGGALIQLKPADTATAENCGFCHALLHEAHQHLIQAEQRRIECACDACAVLFTGDGQTRYRRIPRDIRFLQSFCLEDGQWEAMAIPIGIAFFFRKSTDGKVAAIYPSPAVAVESQLNLDSWNPVETANPELRKLRPDVEGLLVCRMRSRREHFLIPIDECFKLIGLVRIHWRGFSGGARVWEEVQHFLDALKNRAR